MNTSPTSEGSTVEMGSAEANPVIVCGRRRSVKIRRSIGEVEDILVMETLVMLLAVMVTRLARSAEQSCLYSNFPSHRLLLASCVQLFHFVIHRHLDFYNASGNCKMQQKHPSKATNWVPMSIAYPSHSQSQSYSISWYHHDNIMISSWQYHDIIMTITWYHHDNIMISSWQ